MSQPMSFTKTVVGGGVTIQKSYQRTDEHAAGWILDSIPVAKTGVTNTFDNTGGNNATVDLPANHGYTNGTFDVYWSGGKRYSIPGTVDNNTLTLAGGAGDSFPADNTAVIVARQTTRNVIIDGNAVTGIALSMEFVPPTATAKASADFQDSDNNSVGQIDLEANTPRDYDVEGGDTSPLNGTSATVKVSHADVTNTGTLKIILLSNAVPS